MVQKVQIRSIMIKKFFNAIWQFCSYLFIPQWGKKRREAQEQYERQIWKESSVKD